MMYRSSTTAGVLIIELLNVINHEGTSVSLYRKCYDVRHQCLHVCMLVCVRVCVFLCVMLLWLVSRHLAWQHLCGTGVNFQDSPKHNLDVFHLIYQTLHAETP